MKNSITLLVSYAFLLTACSTAVSIKNPDGSTMSGSMLNGSLSYSTGPACKPATPNGTTPPPVASVPMSVKTICEGANCVHMLVADTAPACYTQIATVQGTDVTTYFGWALGFIGAIITAVATGT